MTDFNCENGPEDVVLLRNQLAVARNEISNLRQQLTSLKHTYRKDCDEIRRQLANWRCLECRNQQVAPANHRVSDNHIDLPLQYIGLISTHFPEKRGTPRQPGICPELVAKVTLNNAVFTNPEHALEGLQEYSHMWILFHFHKNDSTHTRAKVAPPRLNGLRTGVFATRSPHRPCPIGLSLVKIDRIVENTVYFSGVDMVDQTPVLDIKPYIPQYDNPTISIPFNDSVGNISSLPALSLCESDSLMNICSLGSLSFNVPISEEESNVRVMVGQETGERASPVIGASFTPTPSPSIDLRNSYSDLRPVSRIGEREAPDGEREAPDGEEEETPQQATASTGITQRQVRTPMWIDQPPVSTLTVNFKQMALMQLRQLGHDGEQKKIAITNLLQEDPRSVYLRERMENTNYVFRIAELYVSCKFDDASHAVTVLQVFQDSVAQGDE